MNHCPRCKAALASEEVEREKPPEVPPFSANSSQQNARKDLSTASALTPKRPMPNARQNQSTRPSKQNTSASQPLLPSTTDAANPISSISASASRLPKTATGPSQDTVRSSNRSSKRVWQQLDPLYLIAHQYSRIITFTLLIFVLEISYHRPAVLVMYQQIVIGSIKPDQGFQGQTAMLESTHTNRQPGKFLPTKCSEKYHLDGYGLPGFWR